MTILAMHFYPIICLYCAHIRMIFISNKTVPDDHKSQVAPVSVTIKFTLTCASWCCCWFHMIASQCICVITVSMQI